MNYQGSKQGIVEFILPHIEHELIGRSHYVEPFVGGANVIEHIDSRCNRCGYDKNPQLIMLYHHLQNEVTYDERLGYVFPDGMFPDITKEQYHHIRSHQKDYPMWLCGYVGVCCAFNTTWWQGYAPIDKQLLNRASLVRQFTSTYSEGLRGVRFGVGSFEDVVYPDDLSDYVFYCDPPYAGSRGSYGSRTCGDFKFDYELFYSWCRDLVKRGAVVFVSAYSMPEDFRCVWSQVVINGCSRTRKATTGVERSIEKLFRLG